MTRGNIFCSQPACTCCASIEVSPFIPFFLFASVSSVELVKATPCETSLDLLCHSLHRTTFGGKYDGFILLRKPFLDCRRLLAGMWPNGE